MGAGAAVWALIRGKDEPQLVSYNPTQEVPNETSIDDSTTALRPTKEAASDTLPEKSAESLESSTGTAPPASQSATGVSTAAQTSGSAPVQAVQHDTAPADPSTDDKELPAFTFSSDATPAMPKDNEVAMKKAKTKETPAKRRGVAVLTPYVSDAIDLSEANGDCALCAGVGVLPVNPFKQYVAAVGDPRMQPL